MFRSALCALLLGGLILAGGPALVGAAVIVSPSPLARYREAHAALAGGELARALATFEGLPGDFVLADYAAFFGAEALLRAGEEVAALERLRTFPDRFPDSVLAPQALLAATDTAFRLGRWSDAEREARRFLGRAPNHGEAGRILVRLAEARAGQGFVAEAVADLRRRWIEAPASSWGEVAYEIMDDLARRHGVAVAPLTTEEQLTQAQRFAEAGELAAAVRVLEELLAQGPEVGVRHRALGRLAPALGRLGRGPEGVVLVQAALAEPPSPQRAALLYELARLLNRTGQAAAAATVLERVLAEHPDASLIPEAWISLARTRLDLGQPDAARATFQSLVEKHPESLSAASARWELAWLSYRSGRFRDAAIEFRQLSTAVASFRLAGLYWAARSLDATGEKAAAAALYREVVSRGPNTYYGILGERRVRGKLPSPTATPVRLAADPLALLEREPHFQKARALASIGFEGHALGELESFGKNALIESDRAWSLGVAFAQIGETGRSLRYLRRAFGSAAEAGAPGLPARFWRLYYPLGYADIIKGAAQRVGLDPFFVAAVIREESSYDPRARSWVGAVGLMQLMPETARVVAAEAGVSFTEPAGLWEPPVNIALGAHYLARLRARFQEPLLAVAGYNAGPHRVQRWLGERPSADLEEFVDQIPFDETRAFVKRVFTSWHHYRRLHGPGERVPRRGEVEAAPSAPPR